MRDAVPEATPRFALVRRPQPGEPVRLIVPAGAEAPAFPLFVKPVKGAFSAHSARVEDAGQLAAFLHNPELEAYTRDYLRLHHRLQARYAPDLVEASAFLVEELLCGDQVTVEGFVCGGTVTILGVVDSVFHPGRRSFARFEYPSALPPEAQTTLHDMARRAITALGLESCLFNVEMTYDTASGRAGILEVNPRMCGQFADLYQKVDGTHGYAVALALARGETPAVRRQAGRYAYAASIPLRVFTPTRVHRVPDAGDVAAAESLFDGTLVWVECARGDCLADFTSIEDGASARYAVVNVGAAQRDELVSRANAVSARLAFELDPVDGESESNRHVSPNS
jgi:biotin carboxylase